MKKITEKWWFWVIFAVVAIALFTTAVMITSRNVDNEYENTTKLNKYLKESNENRQKSWESLQY